ncbi:MAG: hypothetical protein CUN55_08925 [Phototrophicales bacterium]|nr:MAG: hypothetical protein CUN55_08925 [Phototrophicales bacterium]
MSARILVVDDEPTIRKFIVRALEREGYEVESTSDGQKAYEMLMQSSFDVLLTDIRMDYLDGVGLLRRIKREQPLLAVILFTGHATVQTAIEALRYGAFDYLLKPVKNEHIIDTVAKALQFREQQQRRERLESIADQIVMALQPTSSTTAATDGKILTVGDIIVDTTAYKTFVRGESIHLTPTEFRLLAALASTPGQVWEYLPLVEKACGYQCSRDEARQIISTHVINLRHKLQIPEHEIGYVEVVRGVGYRLKSTE